MARTFHIQLIDDLTGEDADETVRFSVDGADYEIDLTAANAANLRAALSKYTAKGRRLRGSSKASAGTAAPLSREETRKIRDWANAHGYNPSDRGRIRQDIRNGTRPPHEGFCSNAGGLPLAWAGVPEPQPFFFQRLGHFTFVRSMPRRSASKVMTAAKR